MTNLELMLKGSFARKGTGASVMRMVLVECVIAQCSQ
jgi:hypothetical protein